MQVFFLLHRTIPLSLAYVTQHHLVIRSWSSSLALIDMLMSHRDRGTFLRTQAKNSDGASHTLAQSHPCRRDTHL